MRPTQVYLALCILSALLPYTRCVPAVIQDSLNLPTLIAEIASSRIAAFGWSVVKISVLPLLMFIVRDARANEVSPRWLPIVGTIIVGVSLGLPPYPLLRAPLLAVSHPLNVRAQVASGRLG